MQIQWIQINSLASRLSAYCVQVALLALVVIITYGHTLTVPFYLDDFSSIQENPVIYHWQGTLAELWHFASLRIVGYLTFAWNYQLHQFQLPGYHIVNISIHFLASCTILVLFRGLVRTPLLANTLSKEAKCWLPLVIALFFVLHPLQIQSVTYIVQRLASLAALFYIGAMACFIQGRILFHQVLVENNNEQSPNGLLSKQLKIVGWSMGCVLCIILAILTKQNSFTLPFALLLLEFLFFPGKKLRLIVVGAITSLGLLASWIFIAWIFGKNPFSLEAMQALTQETTTISRESYLATQFSVLWTYIRLFFLPVGLHIDYDYPITAGLLGVRPIVALLGHLAVLGLALSLAKRLPVVTFGLVFYYLAHAIESSVIPIADVVFEHRTYLPNLGLCAVCGWILVIELPTWLDKRVVLTITSVLLTVLAVTTWMRNDIWRDPIALWQQNLEQSPNKKRAWTILGKHLIQANRPEEGLEALKKATLSRTNPDGTQSMTLSTEAVLNMVVAYKMLKQYDQALSWINQALNSSLRPFDRAKFLVNQGNIFFEQKRYADAEIAYHQAIEAYPNNLTARNNLAAILAATNRETAAEQLYLEILAINPTDTIAQQNLAKIRAGTHLKP